MLAQGFVSRIAVLAASLTLLGRATGPRVVTRTGARRGDALYVTGNLGRSLQSGHHCNFSPRLAEGAWLARQPAVRAMLDVSDGLAKDLHALTPSGAAPALDAAMLPRRRGADLRAALTDGEDYELVFALAARADAFVGALGLLAAAQDRDLATVDGLDMLIGQGAIAFEIFFGQAPARDLDEALRELLLA